MPFSPEELLARLIVITRRMSGIHPPIVPTIKLGGMVIDIVSREVRDGDSVVHLSGIEQSLLYLLASRGGQVVSREEILDAVWGTDFIAKSNIVYRHIRGLRVKLQDDYRHPRFIATRAYPRHPRMRLRFAREVLGSSSFSRSRPACWRSGRGCLGHHCQGRSPRAVRHPAT